MWSRFRVFILLSVLPSVFFSALPSSVVCASHTYERNSSTGYGTITTTTNGNVVRATLSNPPINLLDYKLTTDLYNFLVALNTTDAPKVVIFDSADPVFFIAHIDLHLFSGSSPPPPPVNATAILNLYVAIANLIVDLPTIFIGQVSGQAFGEGNELLVHMDMRFAGPGTKLGAFEVGLGLLHANGGSQFLTKLIGRGRASEYLLSSGTVDAYTAATIGWVNRAYGSTKELNAAVEALAHRIATFPAGALSATKASINEQNPSAQSLANDLTRVIQLAATPAAQQAISRFLELSKNQSRGWFELGLDYDLVDLYV